MTRKTIVQIRALDKAAEQAGGYVLPPSAAKVSHAEAQAFTRMRQYCRANKIPMSKLTAEDYRKNGIDRGALK